MPRIALVSLFLLVLLAAPCFASPCEDACKADYDRLQSIEKEKYEGNSYYCGSTETNCWSRETVPSGQPDPCWSMCSQSPFDNSKFQSCCYASGQINDQLSYQSCLADCASANTTQQNQSANITYNVEISSSGSVSVTDLSGNPVSKLANYPVSMKTGSDGNIYLVFQTPGGDREVQLHLAPDSDFRFDPGGDCGAASTASFSAPHSAYLINLPLGSPFEENTQCKSSEHSSIRGSINGGGDFIQGRAVASLAGTARMDSPPPPEEFGRIDVNGSTGLGEPGFELTVSLPAGNVIVNSTGGQTAYSAEPSQGGVTISVLSGSVDIYSSKLPGAKTLLYAGQSALVDPLDINITGPAPSVPCTTSLDCAGDQMCENGKCVTPQCFPAFALTALLGAAFISRGKEA